MNIETAFNFVLFFVRQSFATLAILVGVLIMLATYPLENRHKTKQLLFVTYVALFLLVVDYGEKFFGLIDGGLTATETLAWVVPARTVFSFLGYVLRVALVGLMLTLFVEKAKLLWAVCYLPAVFNALVYSTMFYAPEFSVWYDAHNGYHSGKLSWFAIAVSSVYFVMFLVIIYQRIRRYHQRESIFIAFEAVILMVACAIEAMGTENDKGMLAHAFAVSLLFYYLQLYLHPAMRDALTGLYNRSTFENHMRRRKPLKLLVYIDMNDLKKTNDLKGHAAGDKALVAIAGIVQEVVNTTHIQGVHLRCYRVGGDEFAIAGYSYHKKNVEEGEVQTIMAVVEQNITAHQLSVASAYSVSDGKMTKQQMLQNAEKYMYKRKKKMKGFEE